MNASVIKIGARGAIIISLLAVVALAQYARGLEPKITFGTFTTNGIELKIDSKAWYNGAPVPGSTWALKKLVPTADHFFNFPDIKPGDFGCDVISMHVQKGNAWLCLDFSNLQNNENGINNPEQKSGDSSAGGELADGLQFFGWLDNGDEAFNSGEKILFGTSTRAASTILNKKSYTIGDSKSGNACIQNDARYVAMCWCAGTLSVDTKTGKMSCDGSTLGNAAQTDSVSVDVSIRAASSDDSKFVCTSPVSPPPPSQKPIIVSFTANPTSIVLGHSSKLSWVVTGATSISINQGVGNVGGTSVVVSPTFTKTYTLTATNGAGSVSASATVTVTQPPPTHWPWWWFY